MSVLGLSFPQSLTRIRLTWSRLLGTIVLGIVLAAYVFVRIGSGEDRYAFGWDEGAYLAVARLMLSGFRLHTDILYTGAPAFVYSLAGAFALFGSTVNVARAVTLAISVGGVVGTFEATRRIGGYAGAILAAIAVAINPGYFTYSWSVYTDAPAAALAVIALALILQPRALDDRRWIAASGFAWSLAGLIKPLILPYALTLGLIVAGQRVARVMQSPKREWRSLVRPLALDFLWFSAAAAILPLLWLVTSGPAALEQVAVNGQIRDQLAESLNDAINGVYSFLKRDAGLAILGSCGLVLFAFKRPWLAAAMLAGWLGTVVLQFQTPTYYHHLVVLIPWLAVLGGGLIGQAFQIVSARQWSKAGNILGLGLAVVGVASYLYSLDYVRSFDSGTITPETFPAPELKAIQWLQNKTSPDEFVITDEPMIAFRAGRNLPPEVAVPAGVSITLGYMTDAQLMSVAEKYNVRVIVVWKRFLTMPDWMEWVNQRYAPVRALTDAKGNTHIIYVRME